MARVRICRGRRDGHAMPRVRICCGLWRLGRLAMVMRVGILGSLADLGEGGGEDGGGGEGDHAASPSSGRTVTTLNIPACMCSSMWQWNAQSPGASAVRSKVALPPGWTLIVCLRGW